MNVKCVQSKVLQELEPFSGFLMYSWNYYLELATVYLPTIYIHETSSNTAYLCHPTCLQMTQYAVRSMHSCMLQSGLTNEGNPHW